MSRAEQQSRGRQAGGGSVAGPRRLRERVGDWIESPRIQGVIVALIVINAITLGLETSKTVMAVMGDALRVADRGILAVFAAEIALKLFGRGLGFFRSGWNLFDLVVVGIALVPATGSLSVLRSLRVLRVLRLVSAVRRLRMLVEALLQALPNIGWVAGLLLLVFYVFAVIGTKMFGDDFPEWFGTLGASFYTLFQIMTLESWSMGIARPVIEAHPYAWLYFVSFILTTAFTVLNLFIGIMVNAMQSAHWDEEEQLREAREAAARAEREEILNLLRGLNQRLERLEDSPQAQRPPASLD